LFRLRREGDSGVAEGAVQPISDSANTRVARTTVVRMR